MLSKISISVLFAALTVTICAAESASSIDDLLTNLNEEDDIRNHLDLDDFSRKVGATYDQWLEQVKALDPEVLVQLQKTSEQKSEEQLEDELVASSEDQRFGSLKKAVKSVKKAVVDPVKKTVLDPVKKVVVDPIKQIVSKGLDYFKDEAMKMFKPLIEKALAAVQWSPQEYWKHMTRIPKDFTGTQLDTNDDYGAFHKHGDQATQNMLNFAFGSMPHQSKCETRSGWNEYHPTPFHEIAKNKKGPFSVAPFKYQYQNDPNGYFIEPCNAVSNGFFLSTFNSKVLSSKGNCGSVTSSNPEDFAMNCIDEDHLLQVVTAAMPFGSWFMHGSGGFKLGGFLDVKGMDVQFYFMYRLVLKNYVTNVNIRKALAFGHACNANTVPDESDGIRWVDSNGERLCHLYWARQIKKLLTNSTLIADYTNTDHASAMLKGLPDMSESIAGCVFVTIRAVFHKEFPYGETIYHKLTEILVNALMGGAPDEVKAGAKAMGKALHKDHVLGFEDPKDGLTHILDIFGDFMDAMFFQESGKFGPGTFTLKKLTPVNAGCTLAPHSTWHRKASRVITKFIEMSKSDEVKRSLKSPSAMSKFKMVGIKPTGIYVNTIAGFGAILASLKSTFNMKTLAGADLEKKDILNTPGFIKYITQKFGDGWPKSGDFPTENWDKCTCKRKDIQHKCETGAPTSRPTHFPTRPRTSPPTGTPTARPTALPTRPPSVATRSPTETAPTTAPTDAPTDSLTGSPIKSTALPTGAPNNIGNEAATHSKAARAAADAAQRAADEAKKAASEATKIAEQLKKMGADEDLSVAR